MVIVEPTGIWIYFSTLPSLKVLNFKPPVFQSKFSEKVRPKFSPICHSYNCLLVEKLEAFKEKAYPSTSLTSISNGLTTKEISL
jgi:hypothetical protein